MMVALVVCAALAMLGCSADQEDGSGRGNNGDGSGVDDFGNANATSTASDDFGNTSAANMGASGVVLNPNAQPRGESTVDSSLIWIANSQQGTVSKIDTRTMVELGRFLTSPNGTGLPSRTTVAADGNMAVANRGLATAMIAGDGAGVTKIMANEVDCPDNNGNGVVDTSRDGNWLGWGEDECVVWHRALPEYLSTRPLAWAPNAIPDGLPVLWTSGTSACTGAACTVDILRLNGSDGSTDALVTVMLPAGIDFITSGGTGRGAGPALFSLIDNYGAYGGASDAGGNFWLFIGNTMHLIRVDNVTLEVGIWEEPLANGYGITVDSTGRVFMCGSGGISRFDPATQTWDNSNPTVGMLGMNGCMTDGAGTLWVGGGADGGTAGLHSFDTNTLAHLTSNMVGDPPGVVKGVSIDIDGKVWGVGAPGAIGIGDGTRAFRLDPLTGEVETFAGLVGAYSYSDMTGFGLAQAGYIPVVLD